VNKADVVVIGGSVGGCLAAAAAARTGARVVVLERDAEPTAVVARKGTPQARQLHTLLDGGRRAAEKLLPGLSEDLAAQGSFVGDTGVDFRWYHGGVWKMRTPIDKPVYCQTRPLFEARVREAVRRLPGVGYRFLAGVKEPLHDGGAVRGVRLESGEVLRSDLVIDASGRGTLLPRWLASWGYGEVPERRVSLGLTYVTGVFEAPPRDLLDAMLIVAAEPPHLKRAGFAIRAEGGRCLVTLQGYHGERPPRDIDGFRAYARGLARPEFAELLAGRKPLGELAMHPFPYQLRRDYHQLPRFPRGIVPIADGIASFDPTFGQGMSVAALEAVELHRWLAQGTTDGRLLQALARVVEPVWLMTSLEASRWPQAKGEWPVASRVINWYLDRLLRACADSELAVRAFYDVAHLTAAPESLARPDLLARVLWPEEEEAMTAEAAQLLGRVAASLANPAAAPPPLGAGPNETSGTRQG
jgi:2-polyprenyl-6-methoxyphenol hydroxylase-like FAD-dependent oxidoreductase